MILGIGTDIVDVSRFRVLLENHPKRALKRLFTESEQQYCLAKNDPALHFAARFAAKEALLKALGTGLQQGLKWIDLSVEHSHLGAPEFLLRGKALEMTQERNLLNMHLSMSHTEQTAVAFVILEGGTA